MRVRIDEAGNDRAPARIEAHRIAVQVEMTFGFRRGSDMDDDALVRGDRRVVEGA